MTSSCASSARSRGLAERQIDLVRLSRAIVDTTNYFKAARPRARRAIWQSIQSYRALLAEYHVKDEAVRARLERRPPRQRIRRGSEAIAGFPFFLYGAPSISCPTGRRAGWPGT